jgi:hypothetical protein
MMDLEERLRAILRDCPNVMTVLRTVRDLGLPQGLLFSGAVYQPVWNHLTGRPAEYGIRDFDVGYFDPSDTAYDAEDAVIRQVAAALEPPLRERVEARNQARVQLWFEARFGEPYAPLASAAEALTRFAAPAFAVGAQMEVDDHLTIIAPFGLEDLFALRIRANPLRTVTGLARIIEGVQARWPEVTVTDRSAPDWSRP